MNFIRYLWRRDLKHMFILAAVCALMIVGAIAFEQVAWSQAFLSLFCALPLFIVICLIPIFIIRDWLKDRWRSYRHEKRRVQVEGFEE